MAGLGLLVVTDRYGNEQRAMLDAECVFDR